MVVGRSLSEMKRVLHEKNWIWKKLKGVKKVSLYKISRRVNSLYLSFFLSLSLYSVNKCNFSFSTFWRY